MLQKMPPKTRNGLHDKLNYFKVKPYSYSYALEQYYLLLIYSS